MITWQVLLAILLGAALGYGGMLLAPRWTSKPPKPWAGYAAVAVNAVLTGLLAARHGLSGHFWAQSLFIALLTLASLVDLHDRIIPNEVVLVGLVAGVPLLAATGGFSLSMLWGASAGFLFLLLLALLVKGGMGLGDVKLAAVIGLFLGWPYIWMGLVLSFLTGGLAATAMLVLQRVGRKSHIPFGPYLALGSALTAIYGPDIWAWYMNIY